MKTILNLSVGITLLVMPQVSPTPHGASVPDAVTAAKAAESPVVAGADTLESLQERLQKEVGGQWRLYRRGAGFTERPSIGASFLTGHGVDVPYIIAPSSKDDKVGERPEDFEGNMALEVIATDQRYSVFAGPSCEPELTMKVLTIAGLTLTKEAEDFRLRQVPRKGIPLSLSLSLTKEEEQYRLRHSAADWLDFRLAVTEQSDTAGGKWAPLANGPSPMEIEAYRKLFAEKGPNGGRHRGDPYLWFLRLDCCDAWPAQVTTSATTNNWVLGERWTPYVLLSDQPEQVLLCGSGRPRPWYLKRVEAGEDASGKPAVVMELDSLAAERMSKLTSSNLGCTMAVLFDNTVIQVIVLESKLSDRIVLSGKAFDKALVARIARLLSDSMLEGRAGAGDTELRPYEPEGGQCSFLTPGGKRPVFSSYSKGEGGKTLTVSAFCFDQSGCRCQVRYFDLPPSEVSMSVPEMLGK